MSPFDISEGDLEPPEDENERQLAYEGEQSPSARQSALLISSLAVTPVAPLIFRP